MTRRRKRAVRCTGEWYPDECRRGEQLLQQGQVNRAAEVFQAVLARLDTAAAYPRAAVLERLGRCALTNGTPELALTRLRAAMAVTERLAADSSVQTLQGILQADLGDVLRATGCYAEAGEAYRTALGIAAALHDVRAQAVNLGQLAALALTLGELDEALSGYRAALALFRQLPEPAMAAQVHHQLGRILQRQRQWDEAERHYRQAIDDLRQSGNEHTLQFGRYLNDLAGLLQQRQKTAQDLAQARLLAAEALACVQALDPAATEAWRAYGILADISERQAAGAAEPQRSALQAQARDYRQLQQHGPQFSAAAARLGSTPGYALAVIRGRLGWCFLLGGRADLAAGYLCTAISMLGEQPPDDSAQGLCGTLWAQLAGVYGASGRYAEARSAAEQALQIAAQRRDLHGQSSARQQLGAILQAMQPPLAAERGYREAAHPGAAAAAAPGPAVPGTQWTVTIWEELDTEYVIEPDLLLDGRHEHRIEPWTGTPQIPAGSVRPMLAPAARNYIDADGAVRICLPPDEPELQRQPGCTVIRRRRREVAITGNPAILWLLLSRLDGSRTVAQLLAALAPEQQTGAAQMLGILAATAVIDVSGRPLGRFLHAATKKGVLPGGGLQGSAVLQLVTDGNYREYPGAPQLALSQAIPERLQDFHALTRARRSRRDFLGQPLRRADFDALLETACGITGTLSWAQRRTKLRAYPSSGGLYAVEIYPVVLRVEDLAPAVYHYRAVDGVLEVIRTDIDQARIVSAVLPVEREMVAGTAAMICLTGCFPRHEHKYGEGGYRMLVAEAGHISQNLILAATALGLSARPFGGVFDGLLNQDLGLDEEQEQFLLAVLVGHAADAPAAPEPAAPGET